MSRKLIPLLASTLLALVSFVTPTSATYASNTSTSSATNPCTRSVIASMKGGSYSHVPAYGNNQRCYIESGMENNGVTVLQHSLNQCYGYHLVEDGVYGRHSRDAVTWVQRHRNLTPDGVVRTLNPQQHDVGHLRVLNVDAPTRTQFDVVGRGELEPTSPHS